MTGVEAAGELVTGVLVAGAVERPSGEREGDTSSLCLNCGTGLSGAYCHRCGQPGYVHRSFSAIWHDIAHGVLHFEGKIWNTLPLLVWRPGELTRRYVHGERARFVSPMALFLFSVFLMFALFGAIGAYIELPDNKPPSVAAQQAARTQLPKLEAELKRVRREQARASGSAEERLDRRGDQLDDEVDALRKVTDPQSFTMFGDNTTGWKKLDDGIAKANKNPNLTLYKVQSSAYKFSWALIPLSVPFVWLLYAWHRRFRLYDHAMFVTYSLSFMSLLVIALTLLSKGGAGEDVIAIAAMTIPPVHIYRQLRGAYGTRRRWALLRMMLLVIFASIILTIFSMLLLALGALG
jgi:hypothetical protein